MQNVLLLLKNERYKIFIFFKKKGRKNKILMSCFLCSWSSVGTVVMGMEGYFPPQILKNRFLDSKLSSHFLIIILIDI
jgi:hypothetical protein